MLVLSRKQRQTISLESPTGDVATITAIKLKGNVVRLGIDAPHDWKIRRGELPPAEEERRLPSS